MGLDGTTSEKPFPSFDLMRQARVSEALMCECRELESTLCEAWKSMFLSSDFVQCTPTPFTDADIMSLTNAAYDFIIQPEGRARIKTIKFNSAQVLFGTSIPIEDFAERTSEDLLMHSTHLARHSSSLDKYREALAGLLFRYRECESQDLHLSGMDIQRICNCGNRLVDAQRDRLLKPNMSITDSVILALASLEDPMASGVPWFET